MEEEENNFYDEKSSLELGIEEARKNSIHMMKIKYPPWRDD